MQRSNTLPALHFLAWLGLTTCTGWLIWLADGTPGFILAMFVHGVVLVHYFSLQHECTHYTAFRTRWINDWVAGLCGIVIALAPRFFRYEHCDHHTWTQVIDRDPERIPQPESLPQYLWYLSSVPYWTAKLNELTRHAAGHISEADKVFVPASEFGIVIWEARALVALYLLTILTMVLLNWWAPLWYWIVPVLLGEPVMRYIRMTEHVGMPTVADMRRNTRTNLVAAPIRWLCWNMNFHAEHHYASSVPYHALPRLHERLAGSLICESGGYAGAHRAILGNIARPRDTNGRG